jgi:phosphohistidine phosphatase
MKTLTLLRHAKSSWDEATERDFDRPLNDRGRRAARRIGLEMGKLGLDYDRVIASPATRVIQTLRDVEEGYGRPLAADFDRRLYLAPTELLLEIVHTAGDEAASLLLVGHNPGLESLALWLSGESAKRTELAIKYPTGTIAEMRFPIERWADVGKGVGTLTRFIRPRDLDPELGPDDEG